MELEATDLQSGQTGNLAITNDIWMTPEIPGYDSSHFGSKPGNAPVITEPSQCADGLPAFLGPSTL